MPDNTTSVVNLFVKKIDKSWNTQDLHDIFKEYGEIRSAKVSLNPQNHKSRGYGFVWFKEPESAAKVLEDSQRGAFPFTVEPYIPRLTKIQEEEFKKNINSSKYKGSVIVVSNFDDELSEESLLDYLNKFSEVKGCKFMQIQEINVALVSFKNDETA